MASNQHKFALPEALSAWRQALCGNPALRQDDIDELEDHLLSEMARLQQLGLAEDEAFFVAERRMGTDHQLDQQYQQVHSGRLWRNSVATEQSRASESRFTCYLAFICALLAALAMKLPAAFGITLTDENAGFYLRHASLFAFPFIAVFFIAKRQLSLRYTLLALATVVFASLMIDVYPFADGGSTQQLTTLHLPLLLWLVLGVFYCGERWRDVAGRMDFIRFSGEYLIYYVLIALCGMVLVASTMATFSMIGLDAEWLVQRWMVPCGAIGATVIAAYLVEAKQLALENIAPVLARIFTPLFALLLLSFLVTLLVTGNAFDLNRELLIALDLLLVVVLGLLMYSVSARDVNQQATLFDRLQWVLVLSALLVDVLALLAISSRIAELGWTPNRIAALGENIVLLLSLGGYAWHYGQFIRGKAGFYPLEQWQTRWLPIYAVWFALVVAVFPWLFDFA